jgi:hypothetical protein
MPKNLRREMFRGETRTIAEIAEIRGVSTNTVRLAIMRGLSLDPPSAEQRKQAYADARAHRESDPVYVARRLEHKRKTSKRHYQNSKRMGLTMNTASVTLLNDVLAALESGRTRELRDKIMRSKHYGPTRALLIRAEKRGKAKTAVRELRAEACDTQTMSDVV